MEQVRREEQNPPFPAAAAGGGLVPLVLFAGSLNPPGSGTSLSGPFESPEALQRVVGSRAGTSQALVKHHLGETLQMGLDEEKPSQSSRLAGKELCMEGQAWSNHQAVWWAAALRGSMLPQCWISRAALPTAGHRRVLVTVFLMAGQSSLLSCSTVLDSLGS